MKKYIILMALSTLTLSVFGEGVAQEKTKASKQKACTIKEATSCCTPDGSCSEDKDCKGKKEAVDQGKKAECPGCKAAGETCKTCKAKADLKKGAACGSKPLRQGCGSGGCPSSK